jgi:hypothetical protein
MLTYAGERGVRILSNSWSCYFPQVLCDRKRCTPIRSVCSRMLTYADVCWRMLTHAGVC